MSDITGLIVLGVLALAIFVAFVWLVERTLEPRQ